MESKKYQISIERSGGGLGSFFQTIRSLSQFAASLCGDEVTYDKFTGTNGILNRWSSGKLSLS